MFSPFSLIIPPQNYYNGTSVYSILNFGLVRLKCLVICHYPFQSCSDIFPIFT